METKFQTSFIPKKPMMPSVGGLNTTPVRKHSNSIFMTIATVLFIISLFGAGGVYAYKQYLLQAQVAYKEELATREKQFNTTLIERLKAQDIKITNARKLLDGHLALSSIFEIIGRFTIENVRFMSLDLSAPTTGSDGIKISLQGYGTSLSAVAFQSKVFTQLDQYNLRNIVKNPILSNPSLSSSGTVGFGFTAVVDPTVLSYEKLVTPVTSNTTNIATSSSTDDDVPAGTGSGGTSGSNNPFTNQ